MKRAVLILFGGVALAGCDFELGPGDEVAATAKDSAVASRPAPLIANGQSVPVQPIAENGAQAAASVVQVDSMEGQDAKLFGTAGGDPAMNGLYTHIAFFQGPAEGWRVFRVGDFLGYRVLRVEPGRVDLEITESVADRSPNQPPSIRRMIIVAWQPDAEGAAPDVVTVTPARL